MEGFPLWGRSCCDRDIRGWAHARQDLSVQTLCSQSSGQGSVQWWDSAVSEQYLHLKSPLVMAMHLWVCAHALNRCARLVACTITGGGTSMCTKYDESPVSFFLLLHAFVFFCHSCSLSFVCLFVCLWCAQFCGSPKLAARHVWRIDWFDFHNMKDWQEDNSSLVRVSEQMDTSHLYCLSHKWPATFCFSSAGGLPGWHEQSSLRCKSTYCSRHKQKESMEVYPAKAW